jgi:pyruvate dehydrogenase E1 component alpha subunit
LEIEIKMPQLGQTTDEVRIIRWLVNEGEEVKTGQPLCEVETDKVTMEMESVAGGAVSKLLVKPEDIVIAGDVIAIIVDKVNTPAEKKVAAKPKGKRKDLKNGLEKDHKEMAEASPGKIKEPVSEGHLIKATSLDLKKKKELLDKLGADRAIRIFRKMLTIRLFEERIRLLFLEGKMPGTIHQYIGMEACAVGVCEALEGTDVIASTHRPHGHALAKGIPVREIMAELYGKITGCCRGKGGSMHIGDMDKGVLPAIAIVGANLPIVGGMALAFKMRGEPRVAVSFFGDGASNEGAFHEALNMAAIYDVPAVFVCENNQYGASTNIKDTARIKNIAERVCAYGIRGAIAYGMDVLSVYAAAKEQVELARKGSGPSLLELKTFRLCGHSRRDPCNYISRQEKQYWQKRDPIVLYEKLLLAEKLIDKESVEELRSDVEKEIDEALEFAKNSPDPAPEDTYDDLYVNMEVPG